MRPSTALAQNRQAVQDLVDRYRTANPRVFGSVLHGTDTEESDLDLLVDPLPGTSLLALGGLESALEKLLGVPVQVATPKALKQRLRDDVLAEAQPLQTVDLTLRGDAGDPKYMKAKRLPGYLEDLQKAATNAHDFTKGVNKNAFLANEEKKSAVTMQLTVIGEIAAKVIQNCPDFVARHPEVDWDDMRGLRNRIVHDYSGIDYQTVWDVLQDDLPELLRRLPELRENAE